MVRIEERGGVVRFRVYVQPRASRNEIVGEYGEALKIRLAAAPVEGEANGALVSLLAQKLGVARSAIRIVKGERARRKIVEVEGVSPRIVNALV